MKRENIFCNYKKQKSQGREKKNQKIQNQRVVGRCQRL